MFAIRKELQVMLLIGMVLAVSACGTDVRPTETLTPVDCPGCRLEEQIKSAHSGETINISAGTYTLDSGELVIDKHLTLIGDGPEETVIQAAGSLELATHRVFRITEGSVVTLSGVTIRYGREDSTERRMIPFHSEPFGLPNSGIEGISVEFGGGVYNQGDLTLSGVIVTENFAGGGAGIFNGARVTIENSVISGNTSGGHGGGIFNGGVLIVENVIVEDNVAGSGAGFSNWGNATVTAATIDGNQSMATGGGIQNNSIGDLTLDSTTVSHNGSTVAGGIYNFGRLRAINTTIVNNEARTSAGVDNRGILTLINSTISGNVGSRGGGLVMRPIVQNEGAAMINTILAGNSAALGPDCLGVVTSLGHNLLGIGSGCEIVAKEGDKFGTRERPIDASLGQLKMNGGITDTNALLPGSPAIDAGNNGSCPPVDQRGIQRPQGMSCDIGSFER